MSAFFYLFLKLPIPRTPCGNELYLSLSCLALGLFVFGLLLAALLLSPPEGSIFINFKSIQWVVPGKSDKSILVFLGKYPRWAARYSFAFSVTFYKLVSLRFLCLLSWLFSVSGDGPVPGGISFEFLSIIYIINFLSIILIFYLFYRLKYKKLFFYFLFKSLY